ncbi:MAG: phosphoribosylanthranilate isomerase [Croceibacterium sp.]
MPDTQIKICGLSTPETVDAAVAAGASHIGLVHFEKSPRHVSLAQAAALRARVPERVKVVLLLVSMEPQPTVDAIAAVRPDVVQFHGSESAEWLAWLKQKTPLEIWKAVGVKDAGSLAKALKFKDAVHRVLYDAAAGALPGGNGLALDWSLLANHRHEMPWGLAGGLNADNVADAIRQTGAPLVDTSSGVECAPGVKDADKIRAFCAAVRG